MMYLLRRLADKGHTIVLVTHATNNINTAITCASWPRRRSPWSITDHPDEARRFFK